MRTTPPTVYPDGIDARRRAAEDALAGLGRTVGSVRCAVSQRLVRLGISMTHFHVLTLLHHHGAQPMGHLAEILGASMSSATGIIDRMEERGLVERVRVPDDRRVVLVRLTDGGEALVDEAELVRSEVMRAALGRLDLDQLERISEAAAAMTAAVEAEIRSDPARYATPAPCTHATPAGHAPAAGDAGPAKPA